jgi:dephospho-CoA kinase
MGPPVIGVSGGIGAGKSTVASALAALGCKVVDADKLGHEVLARPEIKQQMTAAWGPGILKPDGSISRRAVAQIVFRADGDRTEHARLTEIVRPVLWKTVRDELERLRSDPTASAGIVLDAALLYEAGLDELCDAVIFVNADRRTRRRRVMQARGWPPEEIDRRETYQKSPGFKLEKADYAVDNTAGIEQTAERVRDIYRRILQARNAEQPGNRR